MREKVQIFGANLALLITVVLTLFSQSVSAQNLGISGNQLSISVPGTSFSTSVTIPASGVVPAVNNVPTNGSGNLTTPKFSFTLEQTGAENTDGVYSVGIVLDEASSQRQLEVYIPGVTFNFDGDGALTGQVNSPNVNIYGRDASGTVAIATTVNSGGVVNFDGSTLSFSAADQIALIQAQGGILADIVTSIDNTGLSYNYKVILKRTNGTNYNFGVNVNDTFAAFPTAGVDEFAIGTAQSNADEGVLNGGYKLTGTVTFGTASSGGGGGAATSDEDEINEASNELEAEVDGIDPLDPDASEKIDSALDTAATLASNSTNAITAGSINTTAQVNTVLDALVTISNTVKKAGDTVKVSGNAPSQTKVVSSTNSLTATLVALKAANTAGTLTLTTTQKAQIETLSSTALTGLRDTLITTTTTADKGAAKAAASDLVAAAAGATQVLSTDLVASGKDFADSLAGNSPTTPGNARKAALSVSGAFRSVSSNILPTASYRPASIISFLASAGSQIAIKDKLAEVVFVESLSTVASDDQVATGEDPILFIFPGFSEDALTIPTTQGLSRRLADGASNIDNAALDEGDRIAPISVFDALILPSFQADGVSVLPDGNVLSVSDGIGFVIAPTSLDELALSDGLAAIGAITTVNEDASLSISAAGTTIAVTFGFELVAAVGTENTGIATFGLPASGDETDLSYVLTVNYADGRSQKLQPFTAAATLFDSIAELGFSIITDRSTGVISIDTVGDFRPGYLVTPMLPLDQSFLNANKDASGLAYRLVDANGDGIGDVEVVSAAGVQLLYGLP